MDPANYGRPLMQPDAYYPQGQVYFNRRQKQSKSYGYKKKDLRQNISPRIPKNLPAPISPSQRLELLKRIYGATPSDHKTLYHHALIKNITIVKQPTPALKTLDKTITKSNSDRAQKIWLFRQQLPKIANKIKSQLQWNGIQDNGLDDIKKYLTQIDDKKIALNPAKTFKVNCWQAVLMMGIDALKSADLVTSEDIKRILPSLNDTSDTLDLLKYNECTNFDGIIKPGDVLFIGDKTHVALCINQNRYGSLWFNGFEIITLSQLLSQLKNNSQSYSLSITRSGILDSKFSKEDSLADLLEINTQKYNSYTKIDKFLKHHNIPFETIQGIPVPAGLIKYSKAPFPTILTRVPSE